MAVWHYVIEAETAASFSRRDDEPPYVGMPVTWVGRLGGPAPVERFVVAKIEPPKIFLEPLQETQ